MLTTSLKIYVWKNIRFAAPPVGKLRFAKPTQPINETKVQVGVQGGTCAQSLPQAILTGLLGSSLGSAAFSAFEAVKDATDLGKSMGGGPTSEDCLFLDIYVPGKALKGNVKLPVINWIYGGAYILGAKDGIYPGTPLIKASGGNVIFVAGNYRLGALGFLAGATMEKDKSATPNVAFYDQRAVLEWIQNNIGLFGGDANDVSAWGESAGAGSILHHLTAKGGKQDPLFKKAVLQSPAFNPQFDRKGEVEKTFQEFAAIAGCGKEAKAGKGLECLRATDFNKIRAAEDKYIESVPDGTFGFGPSTDGDWVRQLPALELATGNFAKGIESLIVSHVSDETGLFVHGQLKNDTAFKGFADWNYANNAAVTAAILKQFPSPEPGSKYKNQNSRLSDYIQYSTFTCNTRWLSEAYKGKTWNVQYSFGGGSHGTDIMADFYDRKTGIGAAVQNLVSPGIAVVMTIYQAYLLSHARTGDPNKLKIRSAPEWPKVTLGPQFENVLDVNRQFKLIKDEKNKGPDCDFWINTFAAVTSGNGLSPPGAVVQSTIVNATGDPSASYVLG
jgi:carboxylesterase type B